MRLRLKSIKVGFNLPTFNKLLSQQTAYDRNYSHSEWGVTLYLAPVYTVHFEC